jgi:hypothetical protein
MPNTNNYNTIASKWRPYIAVTYIVINICDFIFFPIAWSAFQAHHSGNIETQWIPITLKESGLFHIAFGAILGASAWTRGIEKVETIKHDYEYDYDYEYERGQSNKVGKQRKKWGNDE